MGIGQRTHRTERRGWARPEVPDILWPFQDRGHALWRHHPMARQLRLKRIILLIRAFQALSHDTMLNDQGESLLTTLREQAGDFFVLEAALQGQRAPMLAAHEHCLQTLDDFRHALLNGLPLSAYDATHALDDLIVQCAMLEPDI